MANFTARRILKQGYPGTSDFNSETVGTSGTSIGFIGSEGGTDSTYSAVIVALEDGQRKVIQFDASGDNGAGPL